MIEKISDIIIEVNHPREEAFKIFQKKLKAISINWNCLEFSAREAIDCLDKYLDKIELKTNTQK
jgi:hypothetical protein